VGADYSRPVPERGAGRRCDATQIEAPLAGAGPEGAPDRGPPVGAPGVTGERVSGGMGILLFKS
jgi:hypothetical protein